MCCCNCLWHSDVQEWASSSSSNTRIQCPVFHAGPPRRRAPCCPPEWGRVRALCCSKTKVHPKPNTRVRTREDLPATSLVPTSTDGLSLPTSPAATGIMCKCFWNVVFIYSWVFLLLASTRVDLHIHSSNPYLGACFGLLLSKTSCISAFVTLVQLTSDWLSWGNQRLEQLMRWFLSSKSELCVPKYYYKCYCFQIRDIHTNCWHIEQRVAILKMHTWQRIRKSIIGLSHFSLFFFSFFRILFILFDSACLLSASTPNSLSLTTPHNPVEECTVATTTWTLLWAIIAWTQCLDRWAPWPLWIQNRCFIQAYTVTPNSFYVVFSHMQKL